MYPKQTEGEARWEKFGLPQKPALTHLRNAWESLLGVTAITFFFFDALKRFNVNVDKTLLV